MKTTKLFLATLVLGVISLSTLKATPGREQNSSNDKVKNELYSLLKTVPFIDVMDENKSTINVEFRVNQNHEMADIKITGKDKRVVNYATWVLTRKTIKVDPEMKSTSYNVDVTFEIR